MVLDLLQQSPQACYHTPQWEDWYRTPCAQTLHVALQHALWREICALDTPDLDRYLDIFAPKVFVETVPYAFYPTLTIANFIQEMAHACPPDFSHTLPDYRFRGMKVDQWILIRIAHAAPKPPMVWGFLDIGQTFHERLSHYTPADQAYCDLVQALC